VESCKKSPLPACRVIVFVFAISLPDEGLIGPAILELGMHLEERRTNPFLQ
jgi:hypothetical protein